MGIASLVLGIVSLVCGCFLPGLQWIGSIAGLIASFSARLVARTVRKKALQPPDWFVQSSVLCCLQFST